MNKEELMEFLYSRRVLIHNALITMAREAEAQISPDDQSLPAQAVRGYIKSYREDAAKIAEAIKTEDSAFGG